MRQADRSTPPASSVGFSSRYATSERRQVARLLILNDKVQSHEDNVSRHIKTIRLVELG